MSEWAERQMEKNGLVIPGWFLRVSAAIWSLFLVLAVAMVSLLWNTSHQQAVYNERMNSAVEKIDLLAQGIANNSLAIREHVMDSRRHPPDVTQRLEEIRDRVIRIEAGLKSDREM